MTVRSTATAVTGERLDWPDRGDRSLWQPGSVFLCQWRTMTARSLRSARVGGEFLAAVAMPLVFTLGFYLPLRLIMADRGIDYAQFIMPIIVLQTAAFTAVAAAQRATLDKMRGMTRRLSAMPVHSLVPVSARMSTAAVRSVVSISAALLFGALLGFSFNGGALDTIAFVGFSLLVGLLLALGADCLGMTAHSTESTSQLLVLPQLVLGLVSTGFVPESGFPEWARPFARNQPVSHFSSMMRELADGNPTLQTALPALLWLAGLALVFLLWAHHIQTHRRNYL